MADDIAVTPGAGASLGADLISAVYYPRSKIILGADGTNDGDLCDGLPMPTKGIGITIQKEFTRRADTTAYTAGDVVSDSNSATTAQALANAVRANGKRAYLVGLRLITDKKSITPRLRIHFFNATDATMAVDNLPMELLYAELAKYVGSYDLPALSTPADSTNSTLSQAQDDSVRKLLKAAAGTTSLYFILEALDAFTPASGQKFTLEVSLEYAD